MVSNLIRKELQLHRNSIYLALALTLLWMLLYIIASTGDVRFSSGITLREITLGTFYLLLLPLFMLVPIAVGASMASEERTLGVLDWSLALPASRSRQWLVKIGVGLLLSILLGAALPSLLELTLRVRLAPLFGPMMEDPRFNWRGFFLIRSIWPGVYALLLTALAAFASTFARDSFRALLWGALLLGVTLYAQSLTDPQWMLFPAPLGYPLFYARPWVHYLHVGALVLALALLAKANFKFERPRPLQVARQVFVWSLLVMLFGWIANYGEFWMASAGAWAGPMKPTKDFAPDSNKKFQPVPLLAQVGFSLGDLYRIPNSEKIVLNVGDLDEARRNGGDDSGDENREHLIEINVPSGAQRQCPYAHGRITQIDPNGNGYYVKHAYDDFNRMGWSVEACIPTRVPIAYSPNLFPGLALSPLFGIAPLPGQKLKFGWFRGLEGWSYWASVAALVKGRPNLYLESIERLGDNFFYVGFKIGTAYEGNGEGFLVRGIDETQIELLEKVHGAWKTSLSRFSVSSDGRWYAVASEGIANYEIKRVDHSTSHTLPSNGAHLRLTPDDLDYSHPTFMDRGLPIDPNRLNCPPHMFRTSPDGRYVGFLRIFPSDAFGMHRSQKTVEVNVLDLQTGAEQLLNRVELGAFDDSYFMEMRLAWNQEGLLASIVGNHLHLYRLRDRRFETVSPALGIRVPQTKDLAFFSSNVVLIWDEAFLWKLAVPPGL